MGCTVMDGEEKSHILAWRQENITIEDIYKHTGKAKSSIMALHAATRRLSPDVVTATKPHTGLPRQTPTCADGVIWR